MLVAILLGIVQGLTEFIPVSSSGHLALAGAVLGVTTRGLAMDVALHMGTLAAVVVVFRTELFGMLGALLGRVEAPALKRLAGLLVIGTVPIVIAGPLLQPTVERLAASPRAASALLLGTAALLLAGEAFRRRRVIAAGSAAPSRPQAPRDFRRVTNLEGDQRRLAPPDPGDPTGRGLEELTGPRAVSIGVAQCLALAPGISRSGATIAAGMAVGMTRAAATRFSFLLSLPALVGAAVLTLPDLATAGGPPLVEVVAGATAAFVAGYAAIRLLLALVTRFGLQAFAGYCVVIATIGLALTA